LTIKINQTVIGTTHPPYIIAEMSGNHNGDIDNALNIIEKAKKCGANAIKLQTYTPDTITIKSNKPDFMIKKGLWKNRTLYDLYEEAHTPWEWHGILFNKAREVGIDIFSSPFDLTSVDFLEKLDVPAYKIASLEIVDHRLIDYVAKTGKPIIMSTGLSTINEINEAVSIIKKYHNNICLLHCNSGYPTPINESNLKTITDLRERYSLEVGLSDHTLGIISAITAVSLGAVIIEKHFIVDKELGGVDSAFSIGPEELTNLCKMTSEAFSALGKVNYEITESEKISLSSRRSLYIVKNVKKGEIANFDNIRSIRPGMGLAPKYLDKIIGKKFIQDFEIGTATKLEFFEQN
jgi:N-acetylneuraminate synthase